MTSMRFSQKIAFNTLAQVLGKIFSAGTMLVITMMVLRWFGVEDFGRLTAILAYVAYFYLLADFGFNAIIVREAAKNKVRPAEYFSLLLSLRFFLALALIFLALLILLILPSPYNQPFVKQGIFLASMMILAQAFLASANAVFQFKLRYDQSALAVGLGSLVTLILVFLFIKKGFSLLSLVLAFTIGGLVMASAALFLAKRLVPRLRFSVQPKRFKKIFLLTWPLGLTLIFNLVYFKIDKFLIPVLRSFQELGLYEAAYKVFDVSLVFPVFFMNSVFPVLAKMAKEKTAYKRVFKKAFFILLITSFSGMIIGILTTPLIIKIIAGQALPLSVLVLRVLFCSLPLFFLSALLMWDFILKNQQKSLVFIYGAGLLTNLFLNLVFIPQYGILAAAVNTGVTEGVVLFFLFWRRNAN